MATLPQFKKFDIHEEPTALGMKWKLWISELENLFLALGITDKKWQRALLLYYAGPDVHSIYQTLISPEETDLEYGVAKKKLSDYFEPKVNVTYEIYNFRRMKQGEWRAKHQLLSLRGCNQNIKIISINMSIKILIIYATSTPPPLFTNIIQLE